MGDVERDFHEEWLGLVQPVEGLVVSAPVLVEAQCFERQPAARQRQLVELCSPVEREGGAAGVRVADLPRLLAELLELTPDLWDAAAGAYPGGGWAGALPEALSAYAPEGPQTIAPTLGLRRLEGPREAPEGASEAVRAGLGYELLLWELPAGLELDAPETVTGPWHYPPQAKFDRLLRATRVPIGLLTNGDVVRLVYAPHGEASGYLSFRLDDMATVGGRPILDAFLMLLHATRFFGVASEWALPAILEKSRKYQANVTEELGEQVREALTFLLRGFEAAADRDGKALLDAALARENDHLYHGLLTVLLRIVFVLFAEDRGLLPVEHPLYARHYSLFALFDELREDHGLHPDTLSRRYGAWGRLVALFRGLYCGMKSADLELPARRGTLFNPHLYAFLEGWQGPSAPIDNLKLQSEVRLPTLDDETVYRVLQRLIILDGQRLSYRTLDVQQIGSIYEGLLGYHVQRTESAAVCMRPDGVWLEVDAVHAQPAAKRAAFLHEQLNLPKAAAKKLAAQLAGKTRQGMLEVLQGHAVGRRAEQRAKHVARPGQLVLQPGQERRRTSSHYTPRELAQKVVERTLQPLLDCMTQDGTDGPSSESILALRVCDPAMGSGAFLVEACRYLADALVAAWQREGRKVSGDPLLAARRRVAQCCLYGVDKNAPAVELAKLSLWLFTLAKQRPFTFLDSNLRHGDSLLGLSLEQIRAFHWQPPKQADLVELRIERELEEAVAAREQLRELALKENGINPDPRHKEVLLRDADDAMLRLKLIADVCLGAFFAADKDKARERERLRRRDLVVAWLQADDEDERERLRGRLLALQDELHTQHRPFHWPPVSA